jgi:transcriptional regulator with XRE-family HTH domain
MNEKLKAAREARGWTKAEIARYLQISDNTYTPWEFGTRPTERNLNKLCHLLRKSREELGF